MKFKGVLFDKDGTLFDFQKTWNTWSARMIEHFSDGNSGRRNAIADAVGFDLTHQEFDPDSIVIAGTNRQVAECVAAVLPDQNVDQIEDFLMRSSLTATVSEATPLIPFFQLLKDNDLKVGVMTNDTEAGARAHWPRSVRLICWILSQVLTADLAPSQRRGRFLPLPKRWGWHRIRWQWWAIAPMT